MSHSAFHYSPLLVLVSLVISVLASWTALELSCRVHAQRTRRARAFWLGSGAAVMGLGIWAMHYVGMLAMLMEMPVFYHWPTVVLSLLAAVGSSALALYLVSRATLSKLVLAAGGVCMGGGIAAVHYIGMAAVRMSCSITYSPSLVALSLFLAVAISVAALTICFRGRQQDTKLWSIDKLACALLMGLAIPTMHYVGMAAVRMDADPAIGHVSPTYANTIQVSQLGTVALAGAAGLCICAYLVFAQLNRKSQAAQRHLELATNQRDQLSDYQQRLVRAYSQNGVGAWEWTACNDTVAVDPEMRRIFDFDEDVVPGCFFHKLIHQEDQAVWLNKWLEALQSGCKYEDEYRIVHRSGEVRRCRSVATITRNAHGDLESILGMSWDITAEHAQKIHYAEQASRFYVTLEAIGDAVLAVNAAHTILYANPVACQLTGWTAVECIGKPLADIFVLTDETTGHVRGNPVLRCIDAGGKLLSDDGVLVSKSGELYNIRKHVNLTDEHGGAVLTFQDITAARRLARELEHAANHDSLTGLPNRSAFLNQLHRVWEQERDQSRVHCLVMLDLDRFKLVNDTAGHLAGDALIQGIVGVLRSALRPTDYLARMSGDEFLFLLCDTDQNSAAALTQALLHSIENFRFVWDNRTYSVTASMGMVFFDVNSPSIEALTSQVDVALYTSKRNGRNRVAAYETEKGDAAGNLHEMETASDIRAALEDDRFELHAQPIVSLRGANEGGYHEILVRMRDCRGNLVPPSHFIPAAESYGIMQWIDRWVVRQALAAHANDGVNAFSRFAINLSADSLSDPTTWDFVAEQFCETGISPERVTFEVTESGLIRSFKTAASLLEKARSAGCRIALDDFGTGMSSLSYLKQFPPDLIKIDGSFVRKLRTTSLDQSIVRAVSQIAHSMCASTVAECAEDMETVDLLTRLGVDYVQGWATGRPQPLKQVLGEGLSSGQETGSTRFRSTKAGLLNPQLQRAVF